MLIRWNDKFLVGVDEIDTQHRHLIELINSLAAVMGGESSDQTIGRAVDGMVAYADRHFATEEGYMRGYRYPQAEEHVAQHASFRAKTQEMLGRLVDGRLVSAMELTNYLRVWVTHHILHVDKRLGEFLAHRSNRA